MITDLDIPTLEVSMIRHQRRRLREMVCCEKCGAEGKRRSSYAGDRMAYWRCSDLSCNFRWKEPAEVR